MADIDTYRKRNNLDSKTKIFICKGGYGQVKKSLRRRGWFENDDLESPFFDLKWTMKTKDIDHNQIKMHQKVNHFYKMASIVTKNGLSHSLKNLVWWKPVDYNTFYPRAYELFDSNPQEVEEFIEMFKMTKA